MSGSSSSSSSSSSGSMSSSTCSKTSSSRPLTVLAKGRARVAGSMQRSGMFMGVILMRKNNGRIVTTLNGTRPRTVLPEYTPTLLNGR